MNSDVILLIYYLSLFAILINSDVILLIYYLSLFAIVINSDVILYICYRYLQSWSNPVFFLKADTGEIGENFNILCIFVYL